MRLQMVDCKYLHDYPACLEERFKSMSYPHNDPRNFLPSKCPSCAIGRNRRMQSHTPEPESEKPLHPFARRDMPCARCGTIVKVPGNLQKPQCKPCFIIARRESKMRRLAEMVCVKCGDPRSSKAKYCARCYKEARNQPGVCRVSGCVNKSRRAGLCDRHYKYRDKANRIVQMNKRGK